MKLRKFLAAALIGMFLGPVLGAQEPSPLIGTWVGNMAMADGGDNKLTMIIAAGEEEGYTGTIRDEEGLMPEGTELVDMDLTGETLTFSIQTPDLTPINFTLTLGSQSLLGRWEDPTNQTNGTVELKRWKDPAL